MHVKIQISPFTGEFEIAVRINPKEHERLPEGIIERLDMQQRMSIIMDGCLMACGLTDAKVETWARGIPTEKMGAEAP